MRLLKTHEEEGRAIKQREEAEDELQTISVQLDLSLTVTARLVSGVARLSRLLLSLTEWIARELNFNWLIKGRLTSLGRWRSSNLRACARAFCSCGLPLSPGIQSHSLG